ncbi:MAG: DNA translocase FtsK [Eubacteriales bacterium]|nr:DNA translocase FtsK [Eubacteriales bacterium]
MSSRQTGNKKTTSGRKTGASRASGKAQTASGSRKGAKKETAPKSGLEREIGLVVLLIACVFLFISNFGAGGEFGGILSKGMFGIFGLLAYVFPLLVLFSVFFVLANKGNPEALIRIAGLVVCFLSLAALIHMILPGTPEKLGEVWDYCVDGKTGGGVLGGAVCIFLVNALGDIGAVLALAGVLIVCFVAMTGFSVVEGMSRGSQKVYQTAREDMQRRRELADERREQKRLQRKVSGVALDVTIPKQAEDGLQEVKEEPMPAPAAAREETFAEPSRAQAPTEEETRRPFGFTIRTPEPRRTQESPSDAEAQGGLQEIDFSEDDLLKHALSRRELEAEREMERRKNEKGAQAGTTDGEEPPAAREQLQEQAVTEAEAETAREVERLMEEPEAGDPEKKPREAVYEFPPLSLLKKPGSQSGQKDDAAELQEMAAHLQQIMEDFGVNATVVNASRGPAVTRYEVQPAHGVKVSKILALADDIKLNLAVPDVRMEAPIPGKAAVGIEVPNKENSMVMFRELVESREFREHPSKIAFAVGKDIGGNIMVSDIAKMPHLLIAGATGSGKSVCINTLIMSILYKARPDEVKLIMVDPKVVELSAYNGIPHLLIPVVTDPKKAAGALNWAVAEMMGRYNKFAELNVRNMEGYNQKIDSIKDIADDNKPEKMPQIVIIVDELADLMMVAPGEVEDAICRLAQLARAAGIHLIIATQRPSVNVITGLIKANMPSRIAFAVSSGVDSRTILDMNGAEKLLGKGDMLFSPYGIPKPLRVQGAFISDAEVGAVVEFLSSRGAPETGRGTEIAEKMKEMQTAIESAVIPDSGSGSDRDVLFAEAGRFIIEKDKASIGMLQRWFKIGFNRAARIMDQLAEAGVVGEEEGTKPRKVLMSMEELEQYIDEH